MGDPFARLRIERMLGAIPGVLGARGVRDPDAPCTAFEPGEPAGDCQTDGHYLCDECVHRAARCTCGGMYHTNDCPYEERA